MVTKTKTYKCKCGFNTTEVREFGKHLRSSGRADGKGVHKSLGSILLLENAETVTETEVVGPKNPTVKPLEKGMRPNSINLYPPHLGGVKFEYVENAVGYLHQLLNDSRLYHIHIWDEAKNSLVPLRFPDDAYYNPRELAQVVGAEPWRRYFEKRNELLEKISPWVFVGAMGIIVLAMIIFGGK